MLAARPPLDRAEVRGSAQERAADTRGEASEDEVREDEEDVKEREREPEK
jgi:hypothetical protein